MRMCSNECIPAGNFPIPYLGPAPIIATRFIGHLNAYPPSSSDDFSSKPSGVCVVARMMPNETQNARDLVSNMRNGGYCRMRRRYCLGTYQLPHARDRSLAYCERMMAGRKLADRTGWRQVYLRDWVCHSNETSVSSWHTS
jgi:hypothetical protein